MTGGYWGYNATVFANYSAAIRAVAARNMTQPSAFLLAAKFGWDIELDAHSARGGTKVDSSALQEFASEPATIALLHERHDLDLRSHAVEGLSKLTLEYTWLRCRDDNADDHSEDGAY